jgi:hypothetical protein
MMTDTYKNGTAVKPRGRKDVEISRTKRILLINKVLVPAEA